MARGRASGRYRAIALGAGTAAAAAAEAAAEAARLAAKEAGISLEAADLAVGKASTAYHQRESDVAAHQSDSQRRVVSALDPE